MSDPVKRAFLVIFVVTATTLLCLIVPVSAILKFFLVLLGSLVLTAGISMVDNLIHKYRYQRMLRENELRERRQRQQLPPTGHCRVADSQQQTQQRSRRQRGPCH